MSLEVIGYILIALGVFILLAQMHSDIVLSEFYQALLLRNKVDLDDRLSDIESQLDKLIGISFDIQSNTSNIPELKEDWT